MMIDGIFASEAIDSSGEVLDIEGADISDLEDGKGVLNYEHRGDDAPGASPNDIVGKIVYARKIYGEKDCENERQRKYWRQVELPFIYGICRLYDAAGHPGAIAAAAHIRDHVANAEPILARFSIEGSTLKRDGQRLQHTVARRVALTFKPCNRSCDSGLLADPNAPAGFKSNAKTDPLEALAEKFEHPGYARIGAGPEFSTYEPLPEDLGKAYTAGSTNAAPGSLTGGAALQVEDPSLRKRFLMNQAKAALRDWDGTSDFKKFVKFRLPEADPEFLDRFAGLVNDYHLKKKDPPAQAQLFAPGEIGEGQLSIRGRPVPPTPAVDRPAFDEKSGVLHTPRGSFPMYIPGRDPDPSARQAFHNAMTDPVASKVHAYALDNWKKAHRLLKAGKAPDAVVMHATLFSQLSPNTPVPMQELMYGHLVDTMRAAGIDARSPKFAKLKDRWVERDSPHTFPQHSPEHWDRMNDSLRIQNDSKLTGRKAGEIGGFMLANDKFANMSEYHRMHHGLKALVNKHRHDARSAANELMREKIEFKNHENRRDNAEKKGKPDPGEYQGIPVRGLAPKTARYMYGMMGGGNVVVPDTHFVRHLFGLEKGRDTAAIEYIKNLLWEERNSPLLEGIDRYYAGNHDAMKHIVEHPMLKGSSVSPDDTLFPAFWRHWMAIVPHEQARNMRTQGYNEYTDHRPYWEAIGDFIDSVKKSDQDDWTKATETAKEHLHWVETLGEGPALIMYCAYLLPRLLGNAYDVFEGSPPESGKQGDLAEVGSQYAVSGDPNGNVDAAAMVRKFESIAVDLSVACERLRKTAAIDPKAVHAKIDPVEYQGKKVLPGWLEINPVARQASEPHGYAVLGSDPTHLHVVPAPKGLRGLKSWAPGDVRRISRLGKDTSYRVHVWPETIDNGHTVDADKHGNAAFNTSGAQRKLIHGFDFSSKPVQQLNARNPGDATEAEWRRHPDGSVAFVKHNYRPSEFPDVRREVAFHNLARDVFGLGDMLTPTALARHPRTDREMAVVRRIPGFEHYGIDQDHINALHRMGREGSLDKAALMDYVLGQFDRHDGNWGLAPDKTGQHQLKLIDHSHGWAQDPGTRMDVPDYLIQYHALEHPQVRHNSGNQTPDMLRMPLHQEASKWIQGVSPDALMQSMRSMQVPEQYVNAAVQRLKYAQGLAARGGPILIGEIFDPERVK